MTLRATYVAKSCRKYPDKTHARSCVKRAIFAGNLVRPDKCQRCGVECYPDASHTDYANVLDVEWLCKKCHAMKDLRKECSRGHPYTPENTYVTPAGVRQCKQCKRDTSKSLRRINPDSPTLPRDHKCRRDNVSGLKGAYLDKRTGKYKSGISVDGRYKSLGTFSTAEEAHAAYVKAHTEVQS